MYSLYLYDNSTEDDYRDWDHLLSNLKYTKVIWDESNHRNAFFVEQKSGQQVSSGFLVAHESSIVNFDDGNIEMELKYILQNKDMYCLIISGEPSSELYHWQDQCDRIYRRKTKVTPGKYARDRSFKKYFQRFWLDFETKGKPNWNLVEPDSYPEWLIAAYLMMIAYDRDVNFDKELLHRNGLDKGFQFWRQVKNEADERSLIIRGLPATWDQFLNKKLNNTREDLRLFFLREKDNIT